MAHHPAPMPDTMTGGVDLTGSVDFSEGTPDTLAHLNAQPDVIQTYTGGHGPLAGSVHLEVGGDYEDHESKEVEHGLHEILTRYDGKAVRIRPASRFRTNRFVIAPGQSFIVADRDARRLQLAISIIDPLNGTGSVYVGNNLGTVLAQGFEMSTIAGAPTSLILNHGDSVAIGAPSTNVNNIRVSVAFEIQE